METHEQIVSEIIQFIIENDPVTQQYTPFPRDESLYQKGILDSTAVIEVVAFIERRWSIEILDEEITLEKFGSLNKMARLVLEKKGVRVDAGP